MMAPDFERLARMPCPLASFASSGTRFLSSVLACSCSRWCHCKHGSRQKSRSAPAAAHCDEMISVMNLFIVFLDAPNRVLREARHWIEENRPKLLRLWKEFQMGTQ